MRLSRRALRWLGIGASVALAAIGIWWYATTPGIGSYQASVWLTLPVAVIVLFWLHRRLPMWLQWTASVALVFVGPIGYLVFGGAQWWNWGQLTPVPLLLLLASRTDSPGGGTWGADGAWGPP
jgi:hypothetical protein